MTPLTTSTSPALRSSAPQPATAARSPVDVNNVLANRLAQRLGLPEGALDGKASDYTPEKVAGRIVDFIEMRLRSEAAGGADPAKLQNLLSQAREGVEKGFAEARKILDGMGVLQGKVAADIDDTYQRIQDGLAGLDSRYGSAAQEGVKVPLAGSERFVARAESFEMSVTTREGDRLRISIAQASANYSRSDVAAVGEGGGATGARSRSASLQFGAYQVSVEGNLNEQEKAALSKLFAQVEELSNKFYSGDLAGAFDRALALELDGEQLASMSLTLTQSSMRQASDAYASVAGPGEGASAVNGALREYAQGLLDALRSADEAFQEAAGTLQTLLDGSFALDGRFDEARLEKAERFNGLMLEGLQGLLASDQLGLGQAPGARS